MLDKQMNTVLDCMYQLAQENPAAFIQELARQAIQQCQASNLQVEQVVTLFRQHRDHDPVSR